jgi:hypothetical protein
MENEKTPITEAELSGMTYPEVQDVYLQIIGVKAPVATKKVDLISAILKKQGSTPDESADNEAEADEAEGTKKEKGFIILENVTLDHEKLLAGQSITEEQTERLTKYGLGKLFKVL